MEPRDCTPSNATRRWHHDANNENKPWTIDVQKVSGNEFWDVETNTVIPQFQIGIITNRLLEAVKSLKELKGLGTQPSRQMVVKRKLPQKKVTRYSQVERPSSLIN